MISRRTRGKALHGPADRRRPKALRTRWRTRTTHSKVYSCCVTRMSREAQGLRRDGFGAGGALLGGRLFSSCISRQPGPPVNRAGVRTPVEGRSGYLSGSAALPIMLPVSGTVVPVAGRGDAPAGVRDCDGRERAGTTGGRSSSESRVPNW